MSKFSNVDFNLISKIIYKLKLFPCKTKIKQIKTNSSTKKYTLKSTTKLKLIYRHTQQKFEKIYHDFSFYYFSQVSWHS